MGRGKLFSPPLQALEGKKPYVTRVLIQNDPGVNLGHLKSEQNTLPVLNHVSSCLLPLAVLSVHTETQGVAFRTGKDRKCLPLSLALAGGHNQTLLRSTYTVVAVDVLEHTSSSTSSSK